ncbi:DNA-damage-repair/toleration protein DRT102 [Raphanus sativus]|nr:DNA-damage-repair/toleration protein DRT102 [Raphanus sativus]
MAGATSTATDLPLKIITGADAFGASLKDAMVSHIRSLGIDVEDTGVSSYYSAGSEVGRRVSSASSEVRGLVCCGTGVGVAMFANKFPGVYAATCLTVEDAANARSISDCNVLALSGAKTSPETAAEIFDAWIGTPFKSPCPASGSEPWSSEISSFLDSSLSEMSQIGKPTAGDQESASCAICCLAKNREFAPVEIMPGGSMKIVRETPATSAIVRFKAGSVEPAHHHTFGHGLVVIKGKKSVWNVSKKERADLVEGDYLFTPAGDVHRVKYHEDTEFFIAWDGLWDIFLDEDLVTAKKAIEEEAS